MRVDFNRVRELIRKEFRQLFRDPRTKRVVFGAPLIQLLLFGYAANTDVYDTTTIVVDHDRSLESRWLVDALSATGHFHVVAVSDRPADVAHALDRGRARVGLEIPPGFGRDLKAGAGPALQLLIDGTSSNTATVAQGYAARIVQQHGMQRLAASNAGTAAWAAGPGGVRSAGGVELHARAWFNPALASRLYNVPAVIGLLLLLMSLLLTALAVVRERELGTLDQLKVTPLTPGEMMLGKTIPPALIALVDLALVTALAIAWFGVPFRGSGFALLFAALLFILAGLGFGLLISTISRTQQEAFMGMFLMFLPAVVLSGFMYPITTMPAIFQTLTVLNPVRLFLEIVRGLFLRGSGLAELWPQYVLLAGLSAAVLAAAGWRFRRMLA